MKVRKRERPNGTVTWMLDLGKVGGKRKQLSFPTKEAATAAMGDKKALRQKHGDAALVFNEVDRQRYAAAEKLLKDHGATLEEAVAFFVSHNHRRADIKFGALVERCYEAKLALNKDKRYVRGLRRLGQAFARGGHGGRNAHEITRDDVQAWITSNGWSPKTQNVYLTDLTTIFEYGIAQRHLSINPCKAIERPQVENKPPEILDVAACQRLMKMALETESPDLPRGTRLELLAYVGICLFAGVRPEETQKLVWSEVHLDEKFIEVPAIKAKTRKRRIVTISDNLVAWLSLSRNQAGKVVPVGIQKRMRALRAFAEIEHWPQDVMRHSFASYHLAAHGSAEKTSLQMGHHSTQMLFEHYRELVRPRDAGAFWNILPTCGGND